LETIALKIADFHASWWDSKKIKSLSWIPTIKDIIYMLPPIKDLWDACNKKESFIEALPEGGWEVGTKVVENYLWVIDNFATDMITLVHNDLKSENMFFDVDTPENPLIIFDWSVMNINRGVTDLSLLLAGSVLSDVRYDIEGDILKLYYDRLLSNGIINYSFEECHTDYLKGLLTLTFLPLIVNSRPDLNDPRSVQKNRNGVNRWFSALIDNDAISLLP
jgi:thiamine kinase-like enzyme